MITIVLPISRRDYLKPVFDCLAALEKPKDTELLIITDGNKELDLAITYKLDTINFKHVRVKKFGDSPAESIDDRRHRIAAIHNKARKLISIDNDYVFLIEDDTTYPPETLMQMLDGFNGNPEGTAYIEAVEMGRHKTKYIGAWETDNIDDPKIIKSLMPPDLPSYGLQDIDAGGLYCCLVKAEYYTAHRFEPYDKLGTNGLGCDVNFGLWLKRRGGICYIDWDLNCDHIGDKGSVNLGNTKPVCVQFTKDYNGRWTSRTI